MLNAKMMKSNSRKVLNDFCESKSLHGYSYWYSADSLILKVAWTFVILAATCLGVVFLGNQTREYLDGTILTTIETSSAPLDVSIFIPYLRHYNPRIVYSLPHFSLRFILKGSLYYREFMHVLKNKNSSFFKPRNHRLYTRAVTDQMWVIVACLR